MLDCAMGPGEGAGLAGSASDSVTEKQQCRVQQAVNNSKEAGSKHNWLHYNFCNLQYDCNVIVRIQHAWQTG